MVVEIISVIVILAVITIGYKVAPHRDLGKSKPFLAVFPKYKCLVSVTYNPDVLESKLEEFGFKKVGEKGEGVKFTRGSVLGELSVNLTKVDLHLSSANSTKTCLLVNAGWVAAFDTGDHWILTKDLAEKLENA
ncbi:hypothetical protein [Shewanella woodyi]|uniref:hypothetical protein n=1 Tax=Shewanella woodyi TaxID=60961 RepID=UPI00374967A7